MAIVTQLFICETSPTFFMVGLSTSYFYQQNIIYSPASPQQPMSLGFIPFSLPLRKVAVHGCGWMALTGNIRINSPATIKLFHHPRPSSTAAVEKALFDCSIPIKLNLVTVYQSFFNVKELLCAKFHHRFVQRN